MPSIRNLRLQDWKPYVDIIKKYFGLNHPSLGLELEFVNKGIDPDRTFTIKELIHSDSIGRVFDNYFPNAQSRDAFVCFLWLVGNLYYGDNISLYDQAMFENIEDDLYWSTIEQEILHLYIFMQKHTSAEPVNVRIGKESIKIDNTNAWLQAILNNHVFPNCLPNVQNSSEAEALLLKKGKGAGAPLKHPEVNTIVNGVANLFFDEGLVTENAPLNLCGFLKQYLVLMNLIAEGDTTIDEEWIKAQIHNFKKKSKDPRLFTSESKEVSLEELKEIGNYPVKWAFSHK